VNEITSNGTKIELNMVITALDISQKELIKFDCDPSTLVSESLDQEVCQWSSKTYACSRISPPPFRLIRKSSLDLCSK
jgi:hypothetical protein